MQYRPEVVPPVGHCVHVRTVAQQQQHRRYTLAKHKEPRCPINTPMTIIIAFCAIPGSDLQVSCQEWFISDANVKDKDGSDINENLPI